MPYKKIVLTAAALGLTTLAGRAAVVNEVATFGPLPIGSPSFTLPLNKFDPALGTLTSVKFTIDITTSGGSLAFDNEAGSPGSVTLGIGANVTATTGVSLITTATATASTTGSASILADNDGAADFAGTDSFTLAGGVATDSAFQLNTTANYLAQFTQSAPNHFFLNTISNSIFTNTSTSNVFGPTSAAGGMFSGKLTVAYTYNALPIPEAGTALFGIGLAFVAGFRRVRRQESR